MEGGGEGEVMVFCLCVTFVCKVRAEVELCVHGSEWK